MKATALPRKSNKSFLVQARVDENTKRQIRSCADIEVLDESDIIRRAIAAYLLNRQRPSYAA